MSMETAREFGYDVGDMENEIDRLRAQLADVQNINAKTWAALQDRDAAIARVRDECAAREAEAAESTRLHGTLSFAIMSTRDVLRALDGSTE